MSRAASAVGHEATIGSSWSAFKVPLSFFYFAGIGYTANSQAGPRAEEPCKCFHLQASCVYIVVLLIAMQQKFHFALNLSSLWRRHVRSLPMKSRKGWLVTFVMYMDATHARNVHQSFVVHNYTMHDNELFPWTHRLKKLHLI